MNPRRWQILARCLWALVALSILGWGLVHRFTLPLDPMMDGDAYGYLGPGLSKLTGGLFRHCIGREFLYPAFVFLNLCLFGDFRAITFSQHLLGVGTAGLLLLAWQPFLAICRASGTVARDARSFFAAAAWQFPILIAADIYLAHTQTLVIEHTIRPESVFAFAVLLSIWLNLRFVQRCWLERRPEIAWRTGAAHLFLTCVLLMLRPSFAFAAVFINLPLAVAFCTRAGTWQGKWLPVALAVISAVLFLFLPESLLRQDDLLGTTLNPSMRLFSHADMVLAQMDADLASGQPLPFNRETVRDIRDRLAGVLAASRQPEHSPWAKLGFNPDFMYGQQVVFAEAFARHRAGGPPLAQFCNYYYERVILHHPLEMMDRVLTQLTFFYSFDLARMFPGTHFESFHHFQKNLTKVRLDSADLYPLTVELASNPQVKRLFDLSHAGQIYAKRVNRLSRSEKPIPQPPVLKWIDDLFQAAYPIILTLVLAACAVISWVPRLRASLGLSAWTTLLLYSYNFGVCLTIATVFYLGEARYIYMQRAFTLFSECAGFVFVVRCLGVSRRELFGTRTPAATVGTDVSPDSGAAHAD